MLLPEDLSEDQARAVVLLSKYQEVRREKTGYGYKAPIPRTLEDLDNNVFKQCVTVSKFLREFGFKVGVDYTHWVGYVRSVFDQMSPTIPQPGQLRNKKLLADYCSGRSVQQVLEPLRSEDEMREIYYSVLAPGLQNECTMSLLGLEF